jgi:hypothetical protein
VNIGGVLYGVVLGLMLLVGIRQSVLLWTGSSRFRYRESKPPGFPLAASMWKHYVRTFPVVIIGGGVSFAVAGVIAAVANGIGTVVFASLAVVCIFGIAPLIFLFNQPKALVPPGCRNEVGWITERRRADEGRAT